MNPVPVATVTADVVEPMVVLVDDDNNEVGHLGKLDAHRSPGHLHRAFSVVATGTDGRLLMHRRAAAKYHFGGLWTNTCCSHPRPGESVIDAAVRRTHEELGLDLIDARPVGAFTYYATDLRSGLVEHEHDTVIAARVDGQPMPNPDEVDDYRWVTRDELADWMTDEPAAFTPWLPLALATLDDPTT